MRKARNTFIMTTPIILKESQRMKTRSSYGFRKANSFSTTSFTNEVNKSFVQPQRNTLPQQEENG